MRVYKLTLARIRDIDIGVIIDVTLLKYKRPQVTRLMVVIFEQVLRETWIFSLFHRLSRLSRYNGGCYR